MNTSAGTTGRFLAYGRERVHRLRTESPDLGPLPVIIGLAVIWLVFQSQNPNFLTPRNLSNMVLQTGVTGTLAISAVLVMIAGEMDLSLGSVLGASAAALAVLYGLDGWPAWAALIAMVLVALAIGLLQGSIVVVIGVPSFLVTLGGFLAWAGVQLWLLGNQGEVRVVDPFIQSVANSYLPPAAAWLIVAAAISLWLVAVLLGRRAWTAVGIEPPARWWTFGQVAVVAAALVALVAYLDAYSGVPYLLVLLGTFVVAMEWVTRRTVFGRHLYAIGGGLEAARRAGIPVVSTRIAVFVISSFFASMAALISTSRSFSVSNGTGGGTLLLEAIAAAVIGGVSLFGGRGRIYQGLLGALVIVSVENGLDLLGQPASVKEIATGALLVLAVSVDSINRRRRATSGR